jgi:hypothetical protein
MKTMCFQANLVITLLLGLIAPCANADFARLTIHSEPGDFIGQGQNKTILYTTANSDFFGTTAAADASGAPIYFQFVGGTVTGSNSTNTFVILSFDTFQLGVPFVAGTTYGLPGNTAQRSGFNEPGHPGLDVSFQNRGCNTLTGNFTILAADFSPGGFNALIPNFFKVSFEQHCEGVEPALFGTFTYSNGPLGVPESGTTATLFIVALASLCWLQRLLAITAVRSTN